MTTERWIRFESKQNIASNKYVLESAISDKDTNLLIRINPINAAPLVIINFPSRVVSYRQYNANFKQKISNALRSNCHGLDAWPIFLVENSNYVEEVKRETIGNVYKDTELFHFIVITTNVFLEAVTFSSPKFM